MVLEEIEELNEKADSMKDDLFESLLTPEKFEDCKEAQMEFRPGTGGQESMLFAAEMYEVYKNFCSQNGWRIEELIYSSDGAGNGLKLGSFKVFGENCFKRLRSESGVHKYKILKF